jgi:hypothetical protein
MSESIARRPAQQVALLPEHRGQAAAGPFQIGILQADRERHLGLDTLDAEQANRAIRLG